MTAAGVLGFILRPGSKPVEAASSLESSGNIWLVHAPFKAFFQLTDLIGV